MLYSDMSGTIKKGKKKNQNNKTSLLKVLYQKKKILFGNLIRRNSADSGILHQTAKVCRMWKSMTWMQSKNFPNTLEHVAPLQTTYIKKFVFYLEIPAVNEINFFWISFKIKIQRNWVWVLWEKQFIFHCKLHALSRLLLNSLQFNYMYPSVLANMRFFFFKSRAVHNLDVTMIIL